MFNFLADSIACLPCAYGYKISAKLAASPGPAAPEACQPHLIHTCEIKINSGNFNQKSSSMESGKKALKSHAVNGAN